MKYIISEIQYKLIVEEKQSILKLPGIEYFGGWDMMQKFLNKKGNPLYSVDGDLDLRGTDISSLGSLTSVSGCLDLSYTDISSLGNLTSVGSYLDLRGTNISSLGNLVSVDGDLYLRNTPLSEKMSEEKIRSQVEIKGIYF
jgi:hypothetical protein